MAVLSGGSTPHRWGAGQSPGGMAGRGATTLPLGPANMQETCHARRAKHKRRVEGTVSLHGSLVSKTRLGWKLLDRALGASFVQLGLGGVGFVLADAFLDGSGRRLDEVLGLLEAQA